MSLKTASQIEEDFFLLVRCCCIGQAVRGNVYRGGCRPSNAPTEDAVVSFLSGTDAQLQSGSVALNIYIPYLDVRTRDRGREAEFMQLINRFIWEDVSDYTIETAQTPVVELLPEIHQSCVAVRLRFARMAN